VVMATLPALLMVGIFALVAQVGPAGEAIETLAPITYATMFPFISTLVFVFCAAQAPELFGRDQLVGVMPLYFSRALSRTDYAVARLLGLLASILVLVLAPQLILFLGRVLVAADPFESLMVELPSLPVAIVMGLIVALVVASLSSAIAALTPRRSYATVTIFGIFFIPLAVASLLVALDTGLLGQVALLFSPSQVLDGVNAFLFDTVPDNPAVRRAGNEGWVYVVAAGAWFAGSVAVLLGRYRRLDT